MINKVLEKHLNQQINEEIYSSYLYLSMSAYFESISLKGFSNWTRIQAQEELTHAMKLYDYLAERDGRVTLELVKKPQTEWDNVIDVMENVYSHEQKITSLLNNLVTLALDEKDHALVSFLKFFVDEQVEEESNVKDLLGQLKLVEGKGTGLFMIDKDVKLRIFQPIV